MYMLLFHGQLGGKCGVFPFFMKIFQWHKHTAHAKIRGQRDHVDSTSIMNIVKWMQEF